MARYTKTSAAYRDIVEQADYLAKHSLDAAMRFIDAVERTSEYPTSWPEIGGLCLFRNPRATDLRVWPVRGFPNHLILYRVVNDAVTVVRVLHGARDYDSLFD
jgi:toxin ParE1/3/4